MYKQPITDSTKHSKKGLLSLELDDTGKYVTVEEGKGNADKVLFKLFVCFSSASFSINPVTLTIKTSILCTVFYIPLYFCLGSWC